MKRLQILVAFFALMVLVWTGCQPSYSTSGPAPVQVVPTEAISGKDIVPQPEPTFLPGSVAILVLDDFVVDSDSEEVDWNKRSIIFDRYIKENTDPDNNCIYTAEGQSAFVSKGASAFVVKGAGSDLAGVAHGELVYEDVKSFINRLPVQNGSPAMQGNETHGSELGQNDWIKHVMYYQLGDKQILVVAVDTSDYNTMLLTQNLAQIMQMLRNKNIQRFVINMSFVIMPCPDITGNTVVDDLQKYEDFLKNAFNASLDQVPALKQVKSYSDNNEREKAAYQLAFDPRLGWLRLYSYYLPDESVKYKDKFQHVLKDDLRNYFQEFKDNQVIPVGAAGNFSFPYPFAPAIWNEVLSVGTAAFTYPENGSSYSFNKGEVTAEGCTFYTSKNVMVVGTSFAAPKVSYLAAIYLLRNGTANCNGYAEITPVLGYTNIDRETDDPKFVTWRDLKIDEAVKDFCPDFPAIYDPNPSCPEVKIP